jgi:hypothetical protein
MARFARVLTAAIAFLAAGANALAVGEARVTLVPWEVLDPAEPVDAPLVLFWIPATPDELRRSDLLTSYDLTLFSSRCVAMRVVRFNDSARLARLDVGPDVPMVVLTDRAGTVLGRVEAEDGKLPVSEVEELVREALDEREAQADSLLDRARERSAGRDHTTAMTLYEQVWAERCVCPRQGRDAKRAMRKLGRK